MHARRLAWIVATGMTLTSATASAQLCQELPVLRDEIALALSVDGGGRESRAGAAVAADALGRVGVGFGVDFGGRPTDGVVQEVSAELQTSFGLGSLRVCPRVGVRSQSFSFRRDYDVDRGDATDQSWLAGLAVSTPRVRRGTASAWLTATAGTIRRVFDMEGRRLIVTDEIYTEEVTRRDVSTHLEARLAASVRWRRVGVTVGGGTRPRHGPDGLWFVRVMVGALRLG